MKRFPLLSETFILNELLELERRGADLRLYSLVDGRADDGGRPRHKLLDELQSEVSYLSARQPLKKWRITRGHFDHGGFTTRGLKEICGGDVPRESMLWLQATLLACLVRAQGVSHLHAHFASDATTVARLASRLTDVPFSFTAHAKDIFHDAVDRELLRRKIHEARFVITVSDFNRRHLVELAGQAAAGKIIRLYNGIDLERFRPDPAAPRDPGLVLAVGRLLEKKGFRDLIAACRRLADQGRSFRCEIVGDGPEEEALARLIRELDLGDRVTLTGPQPQERLIESLRRAALCVLPCVVSASGDRDALPTVLLEAMAAGLPVVSTRLVGIPEIVDHGTTGLLVPPGEPDQLARALAEILGDADRQRAFGRAGRARAEALFDLRKNVPVLQKLFEHPAAREGDSPASRSD